MPLSATVIAQNVVLGALGADTDPRRVVAAELHGVADQVDEQLPQQARRRPGTSGSSPTSTTASASRQQRLEVRLGARDAGPEVDGPEAGGRAPDPAEREQVVDQVLHAFRAVDGEGDVLVGALVELPRVPALEHLAEARHLAQRLLQVVGGDVGELLELGVGAAQLLGLELRPARRRPAPGPALHRAEVLVDDAPAHQVGVGRRARRCRAVRSTTTGCSRSPRGDRPHLAAQRRERGGDPAPQRAEERRG